MEHTSNNEAGKNKVVKISGFMIDWYRYTEIRSADRIQKKSMWRYKG